MRLDHAILLGFALAFADGCAAPSPNVPAISGQVERETFLSAIVNDSFVIDVRLPPSYDQSADKRFPVVYQLDGTASFGPEFPITAGFASGLAAAGSIPETIVVGIGYPYTDPGAGLTGNSSAQGRFRDYQTVDNSGTPAGADRFLRFLTEELLPHIDGKFRTDPARRAVSGHSLGGFFALYTMLTTYQKASPPFSGFIVGDPSFYVENYRLLGEEMALSAVTRSLPVSIWIEIARYDGAVQELAFHLMDERLKAHFADIRYGSEIRDTDHPGTTAASYQNGLKHIFGSAQ